MGNWMTLAECVELFRKKRDDLTAERECANWFDSIIA